MYLYFISGNNFAHLKSASFANLVKLTTLEFSPQTLQTIEEGALSNLPSLKELDLRCGQSIVDVDYYSNMKYLHFQPPAVERSSLECGVEFDGISY